MANLLSATTLLGTAVTNPQGEDLGNIKDIMIDFNEGHIGYAVLSFGGIFGMGDKLFAIPWEALTVDTQNEQMILNVDKERLENAPGFDKDNWPDFADRTWGEQIHSYYGYSPYWREQR